jgi:hypothetical protein
MRIGRAGRTLTNIDEHLTNQFWFHNSVFLLPTTEGFPFRDNKTAVRRQSALFLPETLALFVFL